MIRLRLTGVHTARQHDGAFPPVMLDDAGQAFHEGVEQLSGNLLPVDIGELDNFGFDNLPDGVQALASPWLDLLDDLAVQMPQSLPGAQRCLVVELQLIGEVPVTVHIFGDRHHWYW